jgi:hypothetical protein
MTLDSFGKILIKDAFYNPSTSTSKDAERGWGWDTN